jgi:hypothetical protein
MPTLEFLAEIAILKDKLNRIDDIVTEGLTELVYNENLFENIEQTKQKYLTILNIIDNKNWVKTP